MREPVRLALLLLAALSCASLVSATGESDNWTAQPDFNPNVPSDICFGTSGSVSISPSGNKLAVSATCEGIDDQYNVGSVWVFTRNPTTGVWALQTKLTPATAAYSNAGKSIVLTEDRLLAASNDGNSNYGEVFPYTLVGNTWTAKSRITGSTVAAYQNYAETIQMREDLLAVSCRSCDSSAGRVFLYTKDSSTGQWFPASSVTASGSTGLGSSVSIGSNWIAIGANVENGNQGAIYVWKHDGYSITPGMERLSTSSALGPNSFLGESVLVVSDTMIIAATPNAGVYVFTYDSEWGMAGVSASVTATMGFAGTVFYANSILYVTSMFNIYMYTLTGSTLFAVSTFAPGGTDFAVPVSSKAAISENVIVTAAANVFKTFTKGSPPPPTPPKVTTANADNKSKSENMGYGVAIYNGVAVISVPFCVDTTASCDGGHLMYYVKDLNDDWVFDNRLRNPFRNRDNKFGATIQLNPYYLIISAPDSVYGSTPSGAILFYSWNTKKTTSNRFVKDSLIRYRKTDKDYNLGSAIANIDDLTAVGMPEYDQGTSTNVGCAHLFKKKENGKWGQRKTITAPSPAVDDRFGRSVALQSSTRVAISNDPAGSSVRGVFIYNLDEGEWVYSTTLSDAAKPGYGWKVAFFDDMLYISSLGDVTIAGSIQILADDGQGSYTESQTLMATDGVDGEHFGFSFATDGTRLAVGANACIGGTVCGTKGAVYAFTKKDGAWEQQYRFALGAADGSDGFGHDVAILDDTVLVSAPFDASTSRKGAAYFVQNSKTKWKGN